jgi:hypothetical protein
MKVHITYTSEVDSTVVKEVIKTLLNRTGPIHFCNLRPISNIKIEKVIGPFENFQPLDFKVFFNICKYYRSKKDISREDYVVIFTSLRNSDSWFSSFDNDKNIFIDINEWQNLTTTPLKHALAYQVVGNLFHSLIGIDPENFKNDQIVHGKSIGCISDYCNDKSEILLKFRTGYICDDCLTIFYNRVEDKTIIKQIYQIIQDLRKAFVEFQFEEIIVKPLPLRIDNQLKLYIGDNEIALEALNKTLYYYCLIYSNGIKSNDLRKQNSIKELSKIYNYLKGGKLETIEQFKSIHKLCNTEHNKSNGKKSSFTETKTRTNNELVKKIKQIDSSIINIYTINNTDDKNKKGSTFKIELKTEYMNIEAINNLLKD